MSSMAGAFKNLIVHELLVLINGYYKVCSNDDPMVDLDIVKEVFILTQVR